MKKFRILLALLLVLTLALTFSSCGSGGNDNDDEGTSTDQTQDVDDADDADDEDGEDEYGETEDDNDLFDESDEALFEDDEDETDSEDGDDDDEEYDDSDDIEVPSSTGDLTGDYTGEFASDTGTALNLVVQWAANEDDDNYNVTLRFYVDSYSIWVGDRDSNVLKVKTSSGTKEYTFKTKELNREDNKQERVLVGEKTITLSADELASGAKVKATWNYRGSYSGTDLSEITASGEIKG
ncbi:MAG: hypothetical protein K5653_01555 [Clostridiales bacterium]|nr:hypothetical protein [Clostridiales bacterium]